jgi:hypothetical protein
LIPTSISSLVQIFKPFHILYLSGEKRSWHSVHPPRQRQFQSASLVYTQSYSPC